MVPLGAAQDKKLCHACHEAEMPTPNTLHPCCPLMIANMASRGMQSSAKGFLCWGYLISPDPAHTHSPLLCLADLLLPCLSHSPSLSLADLLSISLSLSVGENEHLCSVPTTLNQAPGSAGSWFDHVPSSTDSANPSGHPLQPWTQLAKPVSSRALRIPMEKGTEVSRVSGKRSE